MLKVIKGPLKRAIRGFGFDIIRYNPHASYDPDKVIDGKLVSCSIDGTTVRFFVADARDIIQREHLKQRFYEAEELNIIRNTFKGGTFVDVGANVGNHALYAALFMDASKVIAIELNPAAYRILRANISLNDLHEKITHYAVGLSDAPGYASIGTTTIGNLGRTELNLNDSSGNIRLVTGNEILRNIKVDFIKIDTEGMELKVLKGLSDTIKRDHPTLFVEVDDDNTEEFANFIEYHGYSIKERYRRYPDNENFLAVPESLIK